MRCRTVGAVPDTLRDTMELHMHASPCLSRLAAAVVLAWGGATAQVHAAQVYSQTVFFGDGLTDSGHFRPALALRAGQASA
jgi:outer membrane lipase/esterase